MECFLRDFQTHLATSNLSLPTGPEFYPALKNWQDGPGGAFRRNIGWVNGTVKFISVSFRWTAPVGIPVAPMRQLYDRSKLFLTNKFSGAPASLGEPFFYNGVFSWMETSEQLVQVRAIAATSKAKASEHRASKAIQCNITSKQSKEHQHQSTARQQSHIQPLTPLPTCAQVVLQGFQIIFPCAFAILFLSQSAHASAIGAALAAAYATLTVALITGSLLGGVKVAFGFSLGIGEAIAGNMVIGLSIDYTLHLSHAYMHSDDKTRDGKVSHAATTMGVTVLAGAFTTFTSALFMVPCQLTFFSQMCTRSLSPSLYTLGPPSLSLAPCSLFPSPLPSSLFPSSLTVLAPCCLYLPGTLIGGTIGFSILYALFFFMPLMALLGPPGVERSFLECIGLCKNSHATTPVETRKADSLTSTSM